MLAPGAAGIELKLDAETEPFAFGKPDERSAVPPIGCASREALFEALRCCASFSDESLRPPGCCGSARRLLELVLLTLEFDEARPGIELADEPEDFFDCSCNDAASFLDALLVLFLRLLTAEAFA